MKINNLIVQLKSFIITNFNYNFDDNVYSIIKSLFKDNDSTEEVELAAQLEERNSMKIAIHKKLNEVLITMDTRIKEFIETDALESLEEIEFNDREFVLKSLDISVMFRFKVEHELLESISNREEFIEKFGENVEKTFVKTCHLQMVNIVRSFSSIDYNNFINLEYPKTVVKEFEIIQN